MGWVRTRLTGLLLAAAMVAAAALPLAALAQDQTPTPTPGEPTPTPSASPTPTPTPDPEAEAKARQDEKDRKRKVVRRIYRDFERDGRIAACDHSRKALRIAKRSISDSYDEDFPDFREAVQAAIDRHKKGKCEPLPEDQAAVEPTPTTTPEGGTLDQHSTAPAPAPPPPPPVAPAAPAPESGALPDLGGGEQSDPFPSPPDEGVIPEGTPAPAATPAPTPAGPPRLIVTQSANNANLLVPGMMLAIALAGLLIAAGTAVAGKRSGRFAGVGHAWREAAWRTSGTWADFTDWLRSGR
jgi:hypothetical protein